MAGYSHEIVEPTYPNALAICIIIPNGGHREGVDDCALFRLTDDGLVLYQSAPEFRASIMHLTTDGKSVVEEVSRHATMKGAKDAWDKLIPNEQARTLIKSVPHKSVPAS